MSADDMQDQTKKYREGLFRGDPAKMDEILGVVLDTVKTFSCTSDPREMVEIFTERIGRVILRDHSIALTRRGLDGHRYRITRCSRLANPPDPWRDTNRLPVLEGGILGEFLFGNAPTWTGRCACRCGRSRLRPPVHVGDSKL